MERPRKPLVCLALLGLVLLAGPTWADCPVIEVPNAQGDADDVDVPEGCHLMLVKMWGNGGNQGLQVANPATGGGGAAITAIYKVETGDHFRVSVLRNGEAYHGRGEAAILEEIGAVGAQGQLIIAAGGGGGGASIGSVAPHGGAGGGYAGQDGKDATFDQVPLIGGGGGSQSAGGNGGAGSGNANNNGRPGGAYFCFVQQTPPCGQPGVGNIAPGEGGSGYWGGGGGGGVSTPTHAAGGGGGSSFVAPDARLVYERRFDGNRDTPGNAGDPDRDGAGQGAVYPAQIGGIGRIKVMFPVLTVDPEATTRWKPLRDDDKAVDIFFESPVELQSAKLDIKDPNQVTVTVASQTLVPLGTQPSYRYKLPWKGPWVTDDGRLPAGNYTVVVRGTPVGHGGFELKSDPYERVSLVEVKEVKLETAEGGTLEGNPNAGGGLRIFAEASVPSDVDPNARIHNKVKVTATIEPEMPDAATLAVPITVSFKSLDVDDPAGAPIDEGHPVDNRGTPPEGSWTSGVSGISVVDGKASATLTVSMNQGDNYRVAASTLSGWLDGLMPIGGVDDGSVWHATDGEVPEGSSLSKMLTVWRTLHVEKDRMDTAPYTQEVFQINGTWTEIQGTRKLVDASAPFYGYQNVNHVPDHFVPDDWFGAALNPRIVSTTTFPVIKNDESSVEIAKAFSLLPAVDPNDRRYSLGDDLFANITGGQHLLGLARDLLAEVYIKLEEVNLTSPPRPFLQNLLTGQADLAVPVHANTDRFWNTSVVLAFEGVIAKDFDPAKLPANTSVSFGIASAGSFEPVAFTFLETMHDWHATASGPCRPTVSLSESLESNIAHELMHVLTLGHDGDHTGGLMCSVLKNLLSEGPNRIKLTEAQKKRLRGVTWPSTTVPNNDNCANSNPYCPPIS